MIETILGYFHALVTGAKIKAVGAILGIFILGVVGQNVLAYEILFILVVIDFITGVSCGVMTKTVSSRRMSKSVMKLLLYFLLIIAAHQLTRYADLLTWLEQFLVLFIAVTEMTSIIENAHKLGLPIPSWVTEKLEQYLHNDPTSV